MSPEDPLASDLPVLGLQTSVTTPGVYVTSEDLNLGTHACMVALYPSTFSPGPASNFDIL